MTRPLRNPILLAAVLLATSSAVALAENLPTSRAETWEFSVQTRYISSVDISGESGSFANVEDDLGWGFGFSYNAKPNFSIGFLMSWRDANYTATAAVNGAAVDSLSYSGFLETASIALSADWNLLPKKFTPYLSGAIGYTLVDTNIPADLYGACWYDPWYGYVCNTDVATYSVDAASYSLGVGLRLEVRETLFFKIGYEWDKVDFDNSEDLGMLRIDGGLLIR